MGAKTNARGGGSKNGLAQIMKLVIAVVFTLTFALLNITEPQPHSAELKTDTANAIAAKGNEKPKQATTDSKPAKGNAAAAKETKPAFDANNPATWPKCAAGEIVRADNGQCSKAATPAPTQAAAPQGAPMATQFVGGSGDCAAEIAKYDWNVAVATAVARAESGLNAGALNDNPATGDYSVGCFQVNLYGANARTRPSEAALKNAATNVAWAYNNYKENGSSFIGQWGVCNGKVACY